MIKIKVKLRDITITDPIKHLWFNTSLRLDEIRTFHGRMIGDGMLSAVKYLKDTTGLVLKECIDISDEYRRLCYINDIDLGVSTPSAERMNSWNNEKWRKKNDTS
jgi:hypothetical protein